MNYSMIQEMYLHLPHRGVTDLPATSLAVGNKILAYLDTNPDETNVCISIFNKCKYFAEKSISVDFYFLMLEDISPFCGVTDTPVFVYFLLRLLVMEMAALSQNLDK